MEIDPQTVKQTAPGVLGSLGAMFFMSGPWLVRIGMVVPGGALSYYAAGTVALKFGMPEGLAGFLVGLVGMIFVGKIIATWQELALGALVQKWLAKRFGVNADGDH